ncbi:AP2-like ethylene-responsive transcription factor At2g41710 isoform X2 [Olea europaea var. sylvestris]|uniref:AP2-like ethylene-responsive transcription factor At2g41710 n=1 Tax=Olea europaea subsp. europaea TaxID=158383 RepID=A0A8S0R0D8_OLEEU|nr:AP2-like ethylene-responsive transcription factor At2g41710 isoform X2 [Olea europaea var. sylvestris]CAA2972088.1 AP2-like ethylene-responsive transcription factor At2g41710 [Olea europaea subsp. europaea]
MASSSSKPEEFGGGGGGRGGESSEAAAFPLDTDKLLLYRGLKKAKKERGCTAKDRISKMPPCTAGKRSSVYRGVTRHRWTGRYEAHLWDKSTWNQSQNKKGKQVYLGAYDDEEAAARAYDLAALKYWGPGTLINFPVKDYTRDLEEMQNVSREDYLASLRRKSSGFSRGISKYRPLSSRWDSQFGHMPEAAYFNNTLYGSGDERSIESEYAGGFCIDRKIDLSSYIKWWGANKSSQTDSHSKSLDETKHGCPEDIGSELKALERSNKPTEPYEMPCLGLSLEGKKHKTVSAMNILSQSAAYKSLQENALKKKEKDENDENENKSSIKKIDLGKTDEKFWHDGENERLGVASGIAGGLSMQRNAYPLAPLLSAPLLTNYNAIDPLTDPVLWSSLVSVLPTGSSHTTEVMKNESSSDYTFFQQGD